MNKLPKPRRERKVIDNKFKEEVLRDSVDNKLSSLQIAHKHRCCYNTVTKILNDRNYEYGFWDRAPEPPKSPVRRNDPSVIKIRNGLSSSDRMKELSVDAIEIAELTLKRMKDLLNDPKEKISASQLTSFVQAVSAYSIKKVDGAAKSKDDDKPLSSAAQFTIFKQQVS